jgi:opacity protein-like surface antigen
MTKGPNIGFFGGYQDWGLWRSQITRPPGGELAGSGVFGVRASYDFTSHLGLEGAYTFGGDIRRPRPRLGESNHHFSLNPVWNFLSPGSRARPYLTAGIGAISFRKKVDLMPAFNWGGGVKYALTNTLQLRFDLRNIITSDRQFGPPLINPVPGGVFPVSSGTAGGLQVTAGLGFNLK